jgi:hypothetical protein
VDWYHNYLGHPGIQNWRTISQHLWWLMRSISLYR